MPSSGVAPAVASSAGHSSVDAGEIMAAARSQPADLRLDDIHSSTAPANLPVHGGSGSSLAGDPGAVADASSKSATSSQAARPLTPLSIGTLSVSATDTSPVRPRVAADSGAQRPRPLALTSARSASGSSSSSPSSSVPSQALRQGLQLARSSASPSSIEVADSLPSHRSHGDARAGLPQSAATQRSRASTSGSGSGTDSLEGLGGKFPR